MSQTAGELLHQARLELGLTLEQVEQATRVRTYYLKALEEDDYLSLPSAVQGRGFLRIYAGYLGLDSNQLLSYWQSTPNEAPAATLPTRKIEGEKANDELPERTPLPEKKKRKGKDKSSAVQTDDSGASVAAEESQPSPPPPIPPVPPSALYRGRAEADRASNSEDDSSQAIFAEIGKRLNQQRNLLGLSLADVERYTRLRLHYLEALEAGNMDGLPSPVQGRGMLNNYANFLNLDSEALLFRYADGLQARRIERIGVQPHRQPATQISRGKLAARRFISFDLVVGSGLIVLLVAFIVWGATQVFTAQKQAEAVPSLPPVSEILLGAATELVQTQGSTPLVTSSPSLETGTIQPTQEGGFSGALNFTPLPSGDKPIQVYVVARQTAWIKVLEDGKVSFQGRAQAGSAYPFSGTAKVEVITGNAAAFQVFFNQNELGSLGSEGQVIDLVFDQNGLLIPTATITPTPTKTPSITVTPSSTLTPTPSATTGLPAINTANPSLAPGSP